MSNYLFSGYSFSSELNANFKLQNLLQTQAGEEQQMSLKLLNRQSEGFAIGTKTPHGQTPQFVLDQTIGGSTQNLITLDSSTGQLGLNFNVDLGNTYKVQNSIAPTDDGDLANKLYVDNLARVISIGLSTNTSGLAITGSPIIDSGDINIDLSSLLQNFSDLSSNGLVHKTGADSFTTFAPSSTDGQVLTTNAGTFAWQDLSRVKSIGLTTNTNALAITGSPVTDTGDINIDISTSLQNFSNLNTAGLLEQTGADTYNVLPLGSNNQVLVINNDSLSWTDFNRVTSIGITTNTDALSITGTPITDNGDINVDVSSSLQNLSNLAGTGLIKQTGADTFTNFAPSVTDGQVLVTTGGDFSWTDFNRVTSIGLTTASTGLSITNTPITDNGNINVDLSARLENVSNLSSLGLVVKDGSETFTTTAIGNQDEFLGVDANGDLIWSTVGTVTSVGITGGDGITVSGSPITTNGNIGLTLDANLESLANLATDGVLYKTSNVMSALAIPATNGQIIQSNNGSIEWITPASSGNVTGTGASTLNSLPKITNATTTAISPSSILVENDTDLNISGLLKVDTLKTTSNQDFMSFNSGENRAYIHKSLRIPDGAGHDITSSYGFLNSAGETGTFSGTTPSTYSIDCHNRVLAQEFNAHSSKTIKNILGKNKEITQEALDFFEQLDIVKYQYKDIIKEGDHEYFGVIAEELKEVLPHYVNDHHKFIPNIYCKGTVKKSLNEYYITIDGELPDIKGNKVQVYTDNKCLELEITHTGNSILSTTTDTELPKEVFVYGTYEYSPTVAYNKLWGLGFVALKGIKNKMEFLEKQVQKLTSQIKELTNQGA